MNAPQEIAAEHKTAARGSPDSIHHRRHDVTDVMCKMLKGLLSCYMAPRISS